MSRLRVCFVVESGADVRLIEGLQSIFDLTVLARRIVGGVEISHPPATPVDLHLGPPSRIGFARFTMRYLRRNRASYDAVLVQGYSLAALAANLSGRLTRRPTAMLVCSPIELYYLCRKANPQPGKPFRSHELAALRLLARANARLGQRYIVLSRHLADVVAGHGGRLPIDVIPLYGVDTRAFAPVPEPNAFGKARLGLPTSGAVIFFSSRIAPEKDSETLLDAVRRLRDRGREIWILHRSGGFEGFRRDAERYGIGDRIIATDAVHPIHDLPADYRACDICVQASREEGLGFSPLEALASETPVIATAVGGLRETIVPGSTGLTYPLGDSEALARRIEEILDDPAAALDLAREGRKMVVDRFDALTVFDALATTLTQAAGLTTPTLPTNAPQNA